MYIWVAINADEQLNSIRQRLSDISKQFDFENSCLNLPLHISLKISFEVDNAIADDVVARISDYYSTLDKFQIKIKK